MHTLPTAMIQLLAPFAPPFSRCVWPHIQVLLVGAILAPWLPWEWDAPRPKRAPGGWPRGGTPVGMVVWFLAPLLLRVDLQSQVSTSPSNRSKPRGETWRELGGLSELPSAPEWSFPPRPETHHVRWISPDPNTSGRLFVAVEAGALIQSPDGGETWEDRTPDGPLDTHTLATHKDAPDRLYSAAGDGFMAAGYGYAESGDAGATWRRFAEGLRHHYLWSVAVDPGDPETVVVSAASSPWQAHDPRAAESTIYRKTAGEPWREVREGLPQVEGRIVAVLAANQDEPGVFYALTNEGLYRSPDAGSSWERLEIGRQDQYGRPTGLAVVETG